MREKITEISARISNIIECCATTPSNFAKVLGYTRAQTIYDILNGKSAPSYDFFRRFSESEYSVIISLKWLLSGDAEMWTDFFLRLTHEEQVEVASNINHNVSISSFRILHENENLLVGALITEKGTTEKNIDYLKRSLNKALKENGELKERANLADTFYKKTLEQAEEIGQLKERIAQLEREKGKDVSVAQTSGIANAG